MLTKAEYCDQHESREEMVQNPVYESGHGDLEKNKALCTACGGRCCMRAPGIFSPSDFGSTESQIKKHVTDCVREGKVCFDYWEGQFHGNESPKYVRAATKDKIGKVVDAGWGGECAFLTTKGCELCYNDRPTECRDLVPDEEHCHMDRYNKDTLICEWIAYQGMIEGIIAELEGGVKP